MFGFVCILRIVYGLDKSWVTYTQYAVSNLCKMLITGASPICLKVFLNSEQSFVICIFSIHRQHYLLGSQWNFSVLEIPKTSGTVMLVRVQNVNTLQNIHTMEYRQTWKRMKKLFGDWSGTISNIYCYVKKVMQKHWATSHIYAHNIVLETLVHLISPKELEGELWTTQ